MGYSPFLIAPFKTGLDLDQAPWMAPQDAFKEIINGHIHHGVLEKRSGFDIFGYMVSSPTAVINAITKADPAVVTTVDDPHGFSTGDQVVISGVQGMLQVNGGLFTITFIDSTSFSLDGIDSSTDDYDAYTAVGVVALHIANGETVRRMMGLFRRIDNDGTRDLVAFDTRRAAIFNGTSDAFDPLDTADIFTSNDDNFVWTDNYNFSGSVQNRLYFTNGRFHLVGPGPAFNVTDGLQFFDGLTSTTTRFLPIINPDFAATPLQGCKMLFAIRNRLLLLFTLEGGSEFPQRARWNKALTDPTLPDVWFDATG